jgi:hypothetical protein
MMILYPKKWAARYLIKMKFNMEILKKLENSSEFEPLTKKIFKALNSDSYYLLYLDPDGKEYYKRITILIKRIFKPLSTVLQENSSIKRDKKILCNALISHLEEMNNGN